MKTIKAGRPLVKLAMACYRANIPLLLEGPHGVGKSEIIHQAARELKIGCIVLDLSILEPTDLVGLPIQKNGRTVYCPPACLPDSGEGFLVLEELNRAARYMLAPALQLLTARRLHDYMLSAGWLPVAAINPAEAGYDVAELDAALLSRFVRARVVADREEWLHWAEERHVHPDVLAYARADASIFSSPESNPRSWKYTSDLLLANSEDADLSTLEAAVSGLVGPKRSASFFRYLRDRARPLTAAEVLAAYTEHQARIAEWVAGGNLDLVGGTLKAVTAYLRSRDNFDAVDANSRQWKNLKLFLRDLPGDLREEAERFFRKRRYPWPTTGGASR